MRLGLCLLLLCFGNLCAEPFGNAKIKERDGRTEYTFNDGTVIRAGQQARLLIHDGSREMELEKGAALVSSPKGAGGGLIRVGSAIASFTHGDVEVMNVAGEAKVICLTGKVQVRSTRDLGVRVGLGPGQMVVIPAGGNEKPERTVFNLQVLVNSSGLLKMGPLPSQALIDRNAQKQKGPPAMGAPPGADNNIITGAMTTASIEQQQANTLQEKATQQATIEAQNAARIASARQQAIAQQQQAIAQQQAAQQAAQASQAAALAQQQSNQGQGNQGNAFGPGGNNGGGNNGQGNNGQGNGNNGQGNNGKPPNVPPGQAKK